MAQTNDILTKEQKLFLELSGRQASICDHFYFTGGTPLSAFYLHHRMSEDIDLFCENQEVPILAVRSFLKKIQPELGFVNFDYRQFLGLHSFQLKFSEQNILKVDFNYYPFLRIEKGMKYANIDVDSIYDIAVNKVHTIFMKPRARDFIDIYFILKEKKFQFHDLIKQAKIKFDWHIDPVQFGSRLNLASTTTDFPRMLKPIDHKEWQDFFVKEAEKLKPEIFE